MSGETLHVTRSGVVPIDERLGGLTSAKPHLITGTTGSGKTALCVAFVGAALEKGDSAVMLTEDDPQDLVAQAADLGIDLRRAAAGGRFTMLRYQRDFVTRLGRTLSAASPFDELARMIGPEAPKRLVIDSVTPFLEGDTALGGGVAALTDFMERTRATTLLTYRGDLRDQHDRRLDPLVRACAAILHLSAYGQGVGRVDVVKARWRLKSEAPSFFAIRRGCGVVPLDDGGRDANVPHPFRRQIALFEGDDGLPEELVTALESAYAVSSHGRVSSSSSHVIPADAGAVLVVARWDMLADAGLFLQRVRHVGDRTPVIVVTRGEVRSSDRAGALVAGFDDVVADATGASEFIARVSSIIRRGRSTTVPVATHYGANSAGHTTHAASVLDAERFRDTIEQALDRNGGVFSVVSFNPEPGELDALARVVTRVVRVTTGDVIGLVGDRLAVYLPETRKADVMPVVRRVADAWRRAGHRELRVVQLAYPADGERLRAESRRWASTVQAPVAE